LTLKLFSDDYFPYCLQFVWTIFVYLKHSFSSWFYIASVFLSDFIMLPIIPISKHTGQRKIATKKNSAESMPRNVTSPPEVSKILCNITLTTNPANEKTMSNI
jgi:hypothetical protein